MLTSFSPLVHLTCSRDYSFGEEMRSLRAGLGSKYRSGSDPGAGQGCAGRGAGTLTFRFYGRRGAGPLLPACCTCFFFLLHMFLNQYKHWCFSGEGALTPAPDAELSTRTSPSRGVGRPLGVQRHAWVSSASPVPVAHRRPWEVGFTLLFMGRK